MNSGTMKRYFARLLPVAMAAVLVASAGALWGFINPNFSPVHLVQQSELILHLKFDKPDDKGKVKAVVDTVLKANDTPMEFVEKGQKAPKEIVIDLYAGAFEEQGKAIAASLQRGGSEGMLFIGLFQEEGEAGMAEAGPGARGMLNVGGLWVTITWNAKDNCWDMNRIDAHLNGTWAGATDQLLRVIKYILSDPNADVPVRVNAQWDKATTFATVPGNISGLQTIDLAGDGKLAVLATSDAGDKLFQWDGKAMADVTAKYNVASKSKLALWIDGKLLSSDGTNLLYAGKNVLPEGDKLAPITSLAALQFEKGTTFVVIGTAASPLLMQLTPEPKAPVALVADMSAFKLTPGGVCEVADFDGDSIADIIQLFQNNSLFYKGLGAGKFAAPVAARPALGMGRSGVVVGDFDADGLLDIFTTAEDANRMWHNLGAGQFSEVLSQSGEIGYISKPGGIGGMIGDVNNDGRQDILVYYPAMAPQLFFNRGFGATGHARELDPGEGDENAEILKGAQGGCLGDFNGDGAQDMVLVDKKGQITLYPRQLMDGKALAITVDAGDFAEPVLVKASLPTRDLGAWSIARTGGPAFIGLLDAGKITLKWQIAGGPEQTKDIVVVDKPVRFVLPAPKQ